MGCRSLPVRRPGWLRKIFVKSISNTMIVCGTCHVPAIHRLLKGIVKLHTPPFETDNSPHFAMLTSGPTPPHADFNDKAMFYYEAYQAHVRCLRPDPLHGARGRAHAQPAVAGAGASSAGARHRRRVRDGGARRHVARAPRLPHLDRSRSRASASPVRERVVARHPFCNLLHFEKEYAPRAAAGSAGGAALRAISRRCCAARSSGCWSTTTSTSPTGSMRAACRCCMAASISTTISTSSSHYHPAARRRRSERRRRVPALGAGAGRGGAARRRERSGAAAAP